MKLFAEKDSSVVASPFVAPIASKLPGLENRITFAKQHQKFLSKIIFNVSLNGEKTNYYGCYPCRTFYYYPPGRVGIHLRKHIHSASHLFNFKSYSDGLEFRIAVP